MAQPAPAARPVFSGPWGAARLLFFAAFSCFLIAALCVAFRGVTDELGPALAWGFGGFAAWMLAWVV